MIFIVIEYHIYNFSDCIGKIFLKVLFFYSNLYQRFLISIHFAWFLNLFQCFYSPSHNLLLHFSLSMSGILRKIFLFGLQKGRGGKREKMSSGFFNTLLGKVNPFSYFQHVYQRYCSFCYVLNFCFYIFENLIDSIIFLDILLSLIGALFNYLFLSCFTSLRYLFLAFFIITTTFYCIFITTILHFQNAVLKISI